MPKPCARLPANLTVPCLLGWVKSWYRTKLGAPDGAVNVCSLSMYVACVSWDTLNGLRFEGAIELFRLCLPLAGMIELKDSDAFGKTFSAVRYVRTSFSVKSVLLE